MRNPQDNDTDYNMGITVSVPGERVPRKIYPIRIAEAFKKIWYKVEAIFINFLCSIFSSYEQISAA